MASRVWLWLCCVWLCAGALVGVLADTGNDHDYHGDDHDHDGELEFNDFLRGWVITIIGFATLFLGAHLILTQYLQRTDDEADKSYIPMFLCTLGFTITIAAIGVIPLTILSNEIMLVYPHQHIVYWLNRQLVQDLWNTIFVGAHLCLFVLLPFAYFYHESNEMLPKLQGGRFYYSCFLLLLLSLLVFTLAMVVHSIFWSSLRLRSVIDFVAAYYSLVTLSGSCLFCVVAPFGFYAVTLKGLRKFRPWWFRSSLTLTLERLEMEENTLQCRLDHYNAMGYDTAFESAICPSNLPIDQCAGSDPVDARAADGSNIASPSSLSGVGEPSDPPSSLRLSTQWEHELSLIATRKTEIMNRLQSSSLRVNIISLTIVTLNVTFLTVVSANLVFDILRSFFVDVTYNFLEDAQASPLGSVWFLVEQLNILYVLIISFVGLYTLPVVGIFIRPLRHRTSTPLMIVNVGVALLLSASFPFVARVLYLIDFELFGYYRNCEYISDLLFPVVYRVVFLGGMVTASLHVATVETTRHVVHAGKLFLNSVVRWRNRLADWKWHWR
eukprot:TRINITY_DN1435_c0_g2_i1.p1 TRINITY_DN1435_c0_g2~~TRINITY_DN1435_c0_g2_i1.p1  ORF type:complete len:553 (-),score=91.23 TRINITY_DN1435_c0_g2_i1:174-1832(-)